MALSRSFERTARLESQFSALFICSKELATRRRNAPLFREKFFNSFMHNLVLAH